MVDLAWLVGRDPATIERWTTGRAPLHRVGTKPLYAFLDLISLWVISELDKRRVPKLEIRNGAAYLSRELGTDYPFAHKALATVGSSVFGELGDWVDIGKSGQLAFRDTIKNYLRPVEYGPDELAAVWRPANGVWVNPKVQVGSPCVDGTRVPTGVLAALIDEDEDPEDVADDYELDVTQVIAALEFERAA